MGAVVAEGGQQDFGLFLQDVRARFPSRFK